MGSGEDCGLIGHDAAGGITTIHQAAVGIIVPQRLLRISDR